MGTLGLVTIVDCTTHAVIAKISVGMDGACAYKFAEAIKDEQDDAVYTDPQRLHEIADRCGFGCDDCRGVVFRADGQIITEEIIDEFAAERAVRTFDDPFFNPRWERGIAEHTLVITT